MVSQNISNPTDHELQNESPAAIRLENVSLNQKQVQPSPMTNDPYTPRRPSFTATPLPQLRPMYLPISNSPQASPQPFAAPYSPSTYDNSMQYQPPVQNWNQQQQPQIIPVQNWNQQQHMVASRPPPPSMQPQAYGGPRYPQQFAGQQQFHQPGIVSAPYYNMPPQNPQS
jgi:hypothetical protein